MLRRHLFSILGLTSFVLIGFGSVDGPKTKPGSDSGRRVSQQEVTFVSESCSELSRRFGPGSKLSDLQKDEVWKEYEGKGFKWQLRVSEVSSSILGGYNVQYKCAKNSPSLIQDIQVRYGEERKPFVLQLKKDEVYEIRGVLKMQSTLLGLSADDLP